MDPETPFVLQHLRSVVVHALDTFNFRSAEFACERLLLLAPEDPDCVYLYALTLYRQGHYKAVYNRTNDVLKSHAHLGCVYLFARLCLELEKYKEGIYRLISMAHLYNASDRTSSKTSEAPAYFLSSHLKHNYEANRRVEPDSSAVYHLLGKMYKAEGDVAAAALNYTQALRHNAFDFEAFQELARMGVDVRVKELYRVEADAPFGLVSETRGNKGTAVLGGSSNGPISTNGSNNLNGPNGPTNANGVPGSSEPADTSNLGGASHSGGGGIPGSGLTATPAVSASATPGPVPAAPIRRKRAELSNRGLGAPFSRRAVSKDVEAASAYLTSLYAVFARAYKCMCKYECYRAIRVLESLPTSDRDTPWVLLKLGRLHYEIVNYAQSKRLFVRLRQLDRTRLEDMEYYSTLLWHLHCKVELTYLAHELHDIDSTLPVTWCVMGNLFLLAREPDEAIRCFEKLVALDPSFTYAHTLKGHEHFGSDNYDRALECFRVSLLLDPRHYNAFYGIGMVYINLGEYHKADYHFRKAVSINPVNIILLCCVGMVLEKLGKKTLALRHYDLAHRLQPLSALPMFKRAQLLFSMQQFPQALAQFERVRELAPNEALVHFLLGQLYNIKNDKYQAMREFTIALNLDPKGNYLIREAMEMLKEL